MAFTALVSDAFSRRIVGWRTAYSPVASRPARDRGPFSQGCVPASPAFERAARPTLEEGGRAPALRFGDPQVMALTGAVAITVHTVTGLSNRSLRPLWPDCSVRPTR